MDVGGGGGDEGCVCGEEIRWCDGEEGGDGCGGGDGEGEEEMEIALLRRRRLCGTGVEMGSEIVSVLLWGEGWRALGC